MAQKQCSFSALFFVASLFAFLVSGDASAQAAGHTIVENYDDAIKGARDLRQLDTELFGDLTNLQDGSTEFRVTDVVVPTNSGLPMSFGRRLVMSSAAADVNGNFYGGPAGEAGVFGKHWDMDIPYMRGTFSSAGWVVDSSNPNRRCSIGAYGTMAPPTIQGNGHLAGRDYPARAYWNGNYVNIPGQGEEVLLRPDPAKAMPSDGRFYYAVTKSDWTVSCLERVQNGAGEGYLVRLPNGVSYHFDWMARRRAEPIVDEYLTSSGTSTSRQIAVDRAAVYLYVSKVEDRFGNWISYSYDPVNPQRLMAITSSDGGGINFYYNQSGYISSAVSAGRAWSYGYSAQDLSVAYLPDGSSWNYAYDKLLSTVYSDSRRIWSACTVTVGALAANQPPSPSDVGSITIKHPAGASGVFKFRKLLHGTNNTPGGCTWTYYATYPNSAYEYHQGVPKVYQASSLYEKIIVGPGLDEHKWSYQYFPSWSYGWKYQRTNQSPAVVDECPPPAGCPSTSQTLVSRPDGSQYRYTFGNDYVKNSGQLIEERLEKAGQVLETIGYNYLTDSAGQPFPVSRGWTPSNDSPYASYYRPLLSRSVVRDGVSFFSAVNSYDSFARSLSVSKWNSLGYGKTDLVEYRDDLAKWVLGQVKREVNHDTGKVVSRTEYDPATALPVAQYDFEKLSNTLAYNADGSLASVTNGRYLTTRLLNRKRGIPQTIQYPATPESPSGSSISAVVDDNGWISSVTDENGYTTAYGYDAMGRLASLIYPGADSSAWNNVSQSFHQVNAADRGLPPGHWERVRTEGARRTHTYYDAFWRPVMALDYDADDANRQTQTITRYDAGGRVEFQSYPTKHVGDFGAALPGTTMLYDALGRMTESRQDSEHGYLYTTTQYLPGFQTRVRNPRGFETTTQYEVYDEPSYEMPRTIVHPEGAITDINRNKFGQTVSLLRRNSDFSIGAWRQYVYDPYQQLCKTVEPETGATIMDYDPAGNLAWTASGVSAPDLTQCNRAEAAASGRVVHRTHDARNRLLQLIFPDGNGNQSWTYTPDGLPAQITTFNKGDGQAVSDTDVINRYTYNKRRLLTSEWFSQPGWYEWASGYGYDGNGNLRWHTYPTGLSLDYAPNALGQPTQVKSQADTFASGVSYYPNGAISQFTYGNGLVHRMTQNARQLPREVNNGASDLIYDYDTNGNPAAIRDVNAVQGVYSGNRDLTYDGLDRLTNAHLHWQLNESYAYDVLDNIKRKSDTSGAVRSYWYDANNRLTNIQNENNATVDGLGYDVQGNLQNKSGQSYLFDFGNRLRQVVGKEAYRYDGYGRRVMGRRQDGTYSLSLYNQMGQLVYDEKHNNPSKATDYLYLGSSLLATRERDWAGTPTKVLYQHTDALGSPTAISNESAQVLDRTNYQPYGKSINKVVNGVGYGGHMMDADSGLTYMQQRYYDGEIGRFISVDPIVAGGTGANFNRYKYAENSPYRFTDPDGRMSVGEMIDEGATGCGAVSCVGWATLTGAWSVLGAEGVSQVSDKGSNASAGDKAFAALEILTAGKGKALAQTGSKLAGYIGKAFKAGCSFDGETLVATERGLVPIFKIEVGDRVLSRNEQTGVESYQNVLATFNDWHESTLEVWIEKDGVSDSIITTVEHPFFVFGKGFVRAETLQSGDLLQLASGRYASVARLVGHNVGQRAYNLTVANDHTYFVGRSGAWVHNSCKWRTIVETVEVSRIINSMSPTHRAAYERVVEILSRRKAGLNQHTLSGDLKGQFAIDLPGTGSGRGAVRAIYTEEKNGSVVVRDIFDYHKKGK